MNAAKEEETVYATLPDGTRLCGWMDNGLVMIQGVGHPRIMAFWLSRFEGHQLTEKSLYDFFTQPYNTLPAQREHEGTLKKVRKAVSSYFLSFYK